ncbi:hypothetical protein EJ04DRAFT_142400 [Polyplosphaeria fusca]|uniref:Uncharacterized protein n=1 Tax=Polyplosphaeria fusca TaxID=682080 RepID=A0A9P4R058_9PLEO|nr:hypothetical protein EJ04DRAFT_142400 [Polyplosphaeria fusca]
MRFKMLQDNRTIWDRVKRALFSTREISTGSFVTIDQCVPGDKIRPAWGGFHCERIEQPLEGTVGTIPEHILKEGLVQTFPGYESTVTGIRGDNGQPTLVAGTHFEPMEEAAFTQAVSGAAKTGIYTPIVDSATRASTHALGATVTDPNGSKFKVECTVKPVQPGVWSKRDGLLSTATTRITSQSTVTSRITSTCHPTDTACLPGTSTLTHKTASTNTGHSQFITIRNCSPGVPARPTTTVTTTVVEPSTVAAFKNRVRQDRGNLNHFYARVKSITSSIFSGSPLPQSLIGARDVCAFVLGTVTGAGMGYIWTKHKTDQQVQRKIEACILLILKALEAEDGFKGLFDDQNVRIENTDGARIAINALCADLQSQGLLSLNESQQVSQGCKRKVAAHNQEWTKRRKTSLPGPRRGRPKDQNDDDDDGDNDHHGGAGGSSRRHLGGKANPREDDTGEERSGDRGGIGRRSGGIGRGSGRLGDRGRGGASSGGTPRRARGAGRRYGGIEARKDLGDLKEVNEEDGVTDDTRRGPGGAGGLGSGGDEEMVDVEQDLQPVRGAGRREHGYSLRSASSQSSTGVS